jgi:hypothetical protein
MAFAKIQNPRITSLGGKLPEEKEKTNPVNSNHYVLRATPNLLIPFGRIMFGLQLTPQEGSNHH